MLNIIVALILAQDFGTISGIVIDKTTNYPLIGTNVYVLGTEIGATTDISGRYTIKNIPIKESSIQASMRGYKPLIHTRIYPVPNKTITVNFKLQQSPIKLKEVTVTPQYFPKEKDAVVSSHELLYHEIKANTEGYDVFRALASLVGIAVARNWSAKLIVRGGNPDENLCMIDNIEVGSPIHFGWFGGTGEGMSIVLTELIKDIRFSAGGFPAKYGNKLSSFINVALKEGNKHRFQYGGNRIEFWRTFL